jgi:hypothetical protein
MNKKIVSILVMTLLISLAITSTATILINKNVKEETNSLIKTEDKTSINIDLDDEHLSDSELVTQVELSYLDIPACAFVADGKYTDYHISNAGSVSCNGYGILYAPVYLPKDATINELAAWWTDSTQESGVVSLYRYNPVFRDLELMAEVESIGDQNNYHWDSEHVIDFPEVSDSYMYWLSLTLAPGISCYGARIRFAQPTVLNSDNIILND